MQELLDHLAASLGALAHPEAGEVRAAALFGSRAKGTAVAESDADVLLLTEGGPECSRIVRLGELEVHASYLPAARLRAVPPAKWWEPLATARLLAPGLGLAQAIERARGLWLDAEARRAQARESAQVLQQKLGRVRAEDAAAVPRLRQLADGALSVACFRAGQAEPSKRRRSSGLARALAPAALAPHAALCFPSLGQPALTELRLAARDAFPAYCRWILAHERDPLLRSLPGGANRWWLDTERPAREGAADDVAGYLGFVLERLWLDTAGPREQLAAEPWFHGLLGRARPRVEPGEALALCRAVMARTLLEEGP